MKKCMKCGAVQSDGRNVCIDCGALLGESVSEAEKARTEAELSDKIDTMGDRMEDFHVPAYERVLGIVSIVLAVLMLVSAWISGARLGEIRQERFVSVGRIDDGSGVEDFLWIDEIIEADAATVAAIRVSESLERALLYGLIGAFCFGVAAALFLIPKLVWRLSTLRYRLWFDMDTSPSAFALGVYKVLKYTFFVLGCLAVFAVVSSMF